MYRHLPEAVLLGHATTGIDAAVHALTALAIQVTGVPNEHTGTMRSAFESAGFSDALPRPHRPRSQAWRLWVPGMASGLVTAHGPERVAGPASRPPIGEDAVLCYFDWPTSPCPTGWRCCGYCR
jgi:hypothetical protein